METLKKKATQERFYLTLNQNQLLKLKAIIDEQGELQSLSNVIDFKIAKKNYYEERYQSKLVEMIQMHNALNDN